MHQAHPPEVRARALELLATVGKAEASRQTGIPEGTIAAWGSRAKVAAPSTPEMRDALERRRLTMEERKQNLADRLVRTADKASTRLAELIDAGDVNAKDLVAALGVLIDRLQLLTGAATSRTETTAIVERTPEHEAEVAQVLELARERAA